MKNHAYGLFGSALLLSAASGAASAQYVDIIDPLNPTFTQALGINNAGTIVGYGNSTIFDGFVLNGGSLTRENFPGATGGTQVIGIDKAGDTVGFYIDAAGINHGFMRSSGGGFTTLDQPGTAFNQVLGINQAGTELVGYSSTVSTGVTLQKAFSYTGGAFTNIDALLPETLTVRPPA